MSWAIEEHIGEGRPWPAQVVVHRGETSESLAYVSGEVADRLKAENAQLRELARYIMHQCNDGNPRCDECIGWNDGECVALRRIREMGIEVDA